MPYGYGSANSGSSGPAGGASSGGNYGGNQGGGGGSPSQGGGGGGGGYSDAERHRAQQRAAAAAAAKEAEARASAREKAIQTAALTIKKKEPIFSPHKDTKEQIKEQLALDKQYKDEKDWGFQDTKAQAPTTFKPKTETITIHGKDGSYTKEQPVKYSPTYYQDRSKIGGETWGERARESARPKSGIMGTLGKIALTGLTAGAGAGLFGKDIASLAKVVNWGKRAYDFKQGKGIYRTAYDKLNKLGFNNLTSTIDKAKTAKFRDERTTLGKQDIEDWERKQDWSGIKTDVGGGDGQGGTQAQVPKDVVTASIQKFSPDQMNMMKQRYSQLQGVLDSGTYQGRQLTAEEIQMLQQKSLEIQKLMEQYLVNPQELGLARGGIADLYRYGGFI